MAGTKAGGTTAAATNKQRYGDDFFKRIGSKGAAAGDPKTKGFGYGTVGQERARIYGTIGGSISRIGYKLTDEQKAAIKADAIKRATKRTKRLKLTTAADIRKQLRRQQEELSQIQTSKLSAKYGVKRPW